MIHTLQTQKKVGMIIQLDLSKAYDKVSWNFIEDILDAFDFDQRCIKWILALVTSPSYSILVNGEPKGLISPSRGIPQGDPFPPFLFLLCIEGLHGLIS